MADDMVRIEGGTFLMGSEEFYADERPVHERTVAAFEIDRREVTNEDFADFVDQTGYITVAERPSTRPRCRALIPRTSSRAGSSSRPPRARWI